MAKAAKRAEAQESLLDYAEIVVEGKWSAMTDEAAPSPQTSAALNDLYAVYAHLDEVAGVNQEQYGESLRLLVDVSADRRARILASHSGLPDVL